MEIRLPDLVKTMKKLGFIVYDQPYRLNIVGIRNSAPVNQDKFDDNLAFFWYDESKRLQGRVCPATTDPSTYFLKNPVTTKGAGILKGGQYVNAYIIGTHAGKYTALVQRGGPVTVIRDNDRDGFTNFGNKTETGYFGINIHRASRGKSNEYIISRDSAGCQVFMREEDFNAMMDAAQKSAKLYGNKFTYTLIDTRDYIRSRNTALIVVGLLAIAAYAFYRLKKS